jgi:hypothetical protein
MDSWEFTRLLLEVRSIESSEFGRILLAVPGEYSTNEKWYVTRALQEFARASEGNIDPDLVHDLLPFVRIYGSAEVLREYIAEHGLETARLAGRELRKRQPSQPPGVRTFDPANSFGPVVRPPELTFGPVVNPRKLPPWKPFKRGLW